MRGPTRVPQAEHLIGKEALRDSDSLILVYQGVNQVLYFPRHFFSSDSDWAELRALVAAKLPRK